MGKRRFKKMLVRPEMVYGLKTKEQEVELKTLRFSL